MCTGTPVHHKQTSACASDAPPSASILIPFLYVMLCCSLPPGGVQDWSGRAAVPAVPAGDQLPRVRALQGRAWNQ